MNLLERLLPCRKCGSTDLRLVKLENWAGNLNSYTQHVKCVGCGRKIQGVDDGNGTGSRENLLNQWNARSKEEELAVIKLAFEVRGGMPTVPLEFWTGDWKEPEV